MAAEVYLEEHEEPYIGFNHNGTPIPFAKQRKRIEAWHRKQREEEERVRQQREEHERREYEAIEEAKQRYIDEGEISILGVRTRPDGRIIER